MNRHQSILLATLAAFALTMSGCGGSSSPAPTPTPTPTPTQTISVAINPTPPTSLNAGTTSNLTAVVTNDTANAGVNWTVTCSGSACGSFNPTKTASGAATVYTAPSAPPTSGTVTVTATSVTDTTKTASATITIAAPAPAPISVTLSGQPTSLAIGATASITASVSNDSKNGGVTWTVTCGTSGACGSFSSASTASGTATVYTAPSAVPTSGTVTVTATSVTDTTKTTSATITITAGSTSITVALNPTPPTSLAVSTTANITAVVSNDSANGGVTWAVTCGTSGGCGSVSSASTASGTATVYTAPATIPIPNTVTVTATSVTDTTKSASATITITPPAAITLALNPTPPTSMLATATASLTAVVSNDSKNGGVTWTVTCGTSGACGSVSSASTASGTATAYTAPTTIPNPNTVTITATSVTDTTKSVSATITITPVLADGTYVYHLAGYDSTGPAFTAGAFTVAGSVITGGELDYSNASVGYPALALVPANCSLSVVGNNIQVVLATATTAFGVNGTQTLRGTPVSSSRILISEFDSFATAAGSIDAQATPVVPPSGGYAFEVVGWDFGSSGSLALAIGGVLNFSGSTINLGNSVFDFNQNGTIGQAQLFASGSSISAADAFGRVSISLVPSNSASSGFIFTGYIVSPTQIQLVESQQDALGGDVGGSAIGQGTNTGQFSPTSLSGTTYAFATYGEDVVFSATYGGNLIFNSTGGVTGTLAIQDGTNSAVSPITTGSYTVDITGRVTVSGLVTSAFPTTDFTFQLYLDGNGNATVIGLDQQQFTAGQASLVTATSSDFEGTYALSGRGLIANSSQTLAWGAAGPISVASDNITGATDYTGSAITSAVPLTGTENSSAQPPTMNLVGIDGLAPTSSRQYTYFPIDGKRFFAIESDGAQLGLLTIESNSH
jgi:hypothetical protein